MTIEEGSLRDWNCDGDSQNILINHGENTMADNFEQPDQHLVETFGDIDATLAQRGERYGDFSDHAEIAQDIQNVMRNTQGWHNLDAVKKQALTVIADKQARILSGDPNYGDNWHDIQGYAKLVEDRL